MKEEKLMAHDPLSDADAILSEEYYGQRARRTEPGAPRKRRDSSQRPTHYKVICISMYTRDLEELDAKVAELKRRGWTKANKSQLIRLALARSISTSCRRRTSERRGAQRACRDLVSSSRRMAIRYARSTRRRSAVKNCATSWTLRAS